MLNPILISDELSESGHYSYIDKTWPIIWQVQMSPFEIKRNINLFTFKRTFYYENFKHKQKKVNSIIKLVYYLPSSNNYQQFVNLKNLHIIYQFIGGIILT